MSRGIIKTSRPTEIFPEGGKEIARRVGLTEKVYILKAKEEDDGGGSYELTYRKVNPPVRARVDSYKRAKPRGVVGAKINEFTSHIFTIDKGVDVEPPDRIEREVDNSVWEVIAIEARTDQPTIQVLAKEVSTP